ncbi:MAG: DNA-primase RepB domain-containing protein, partial [bacterium]|nr:DNA-primase RepB domain-containing protein [bacterium]
MKALSIPIEEFLRPFFDSGEKLCIRVFDDRKAGTFKGAKLETSVAQIDSMREILKKHNAKHRGIYFVVNFGGHEDSDITRINAQFMECDDLSFDEQMAKIKAFSIEPSLIVKTQKSLHTYWLTKDAEVSAFRRVQKRLIAQFDGDKTCINESRVLRLPGFNHCKGEPVMVECVKFNPELRYTQAELEAILPQVENEPAKGSSSLLKGSRKGLALVQRRCDFIKHCRENGVTLPEHDWYAMITNLAVFEDGDKAIHELSQQYPKYQSQETQHKIQHFLESGTKPMTCRTIAEKGFKCPRIDNDSCGCKAP